VLEESLHYLHCSATFALLKQFNQFSDKTTYIRKRYTSEWHMTELLVAMQIDI
jgi:hypothetical protein